MAKTILKNKVSQSLQETVNANPHVKEVHFDMKGRHYFNVHTFKGVGKAEKDNGFYAQIGVKNIVDKEGKQLRVESPNLTTKIVETASREDVLAAEPVSDLAINLNNLSVDEQAAIVKMRSGK
jgi:hypothetical protein